MTQLMKLYKEDPVVQHIIENINKEPTSFQYELHTDGRLFYKSRDNDNLLYIPDSLELKQQLLHDYHDAPISGHLGRDKTLERIRRSYYWPGMKRDVEEYVSTCERCQRNKGSNQKPQGLLQPLPIPTRKWEHISMDLITDLPITKKGHNAILTIVDMTCRVSHLAE